VYSVHHRAVGGAAGSDLCAGVDDVYTEFIILGTKTTGTVRWHRSRLAFCERLEVAFHCHDLQGRVVEGAADDVEGVGDSVADVGYGGVKNG